MGRNEQGFWEDEDDFRDNPVEMQDGQWQPVETNQPPIAPPPRPPAPARAARPEPTYEEGDDNWSEEDFEIVDPSEEEEEDFTAVLTDARLRLEQGKLYELIMNHDLFGGTDSDPKAVKNVQREIRRFARERMEVMLGMRPEGRAESPAQATLPFNSLEVEILKKLASKASGGATETAKAEEYAEVIKEPKKPTLNTITTAPRKPAPPAPARKLATAPAAPIKRKAKQPPAEHLPEEEEAPLERPAHEMDPAELLERNKRIAARQAARKAKIPKDRLPPATFEQEEFLATQQALAAGQSPGVTRLVNTINVLTAKAKQMQNKG